MKFTRTLHAGMVGITLLGALTACQSKISTDLSEMYKNSPKYLQALTAIRDKQDFDKAQQLAIEELNEHPENGYAHTLLGLTYSCNEDDDNQEAAIEQFLEAIRQLPANDSDALGMAYTPLGMTYARTSRPEEAIAAFTEALKYDQANESIYTYRGLVYEMLDKVDSARMDFLAALELNPEFTKANVSMARLESTVNPEDSAVFRHCAHAMALSPSFSYAHSTLIKWYLNRGEYDKATDLLIDVLDRCDDEIWDVCFDITRALPPKARETYRAKLRQKGRENLWWYQILGDNYFAYHELSKAIEAYQLAKLRADRKSDELVACYALTANYKEALSLLQTILNSGTLSPRDRLGYLYLRCKLLEVCGRCAEAIVGWKDAVEIASVYSVLPDRQLSLLYEAKGTCELKAAHWQDAQTSLTKAVELGKHNADANVYLADVYMELGDEDKAYVHYEKAIDIDSHYLCYGAYLSQWFVDMIDIERQAAWDDETRIEARYCWARLFARRGETKEAFGLLQRVVADEQRELEASDENHVAGLDTTYCAPAGNREFIDDYIFQSLVEPDFETVRQLPEFTPWIKKVSRERYGI